MSPELMAAYIELLALADKADPAKLEALAARLEQYGFTAEAAKLRALAAAILARRASPGSVPVLPPLSPTAAPAHAGEKALVVTQTDPLMLRNAPNGAVLASMAKGALVMVADWNGAAPTSNAPQGWAKVSYAGQTGYASKQYLQLGGTPSTSTSTPSAPPPPGPAAVQTARVTTVSDPLTLRNAPNGAVLGSLPKGATVVVLRWDAGAPTSNSSQGWAQVSYAGKTGYASKNYLVLNPQVSTSGVPKALDGQGRPVTCAAPRGCQIRSNPSANGKSIAVLPHGETARLVRHVSGAKGSPASPGPGGWCLVRWAGFQGWVPSEWMLLS
jgi:uncharacterized protein YraI